MLLFGAIGDLIGITATIALIGLFVFLTLPFCLILKPALEEIYRRVTDGQLQSVVDRTFRLDKEGAVEAHKYIHARKNLGKIVLTND